MQLMLYILVTSVRCLKCGIKCGHLNLAEWSSNSAYFICMEKKFIQYCALRMSENNIPKELYEKATEDPYSFIHIDKPRKFQTKNFDEVI